MTCAMNSLPLSNCNIVRVIQSCEKASGLFSLSASGLSIGSSGLSASGSSIDSSGLSVSGSFIDSSGLVSGFSVSGLLSGLGSGDLFCIF
ncbi:14957_t:CDS:2 [Dentiscutata heterogama]|uniref:14957_t:CDS:1 n=1 Tax=Dentiscutata heterogama TaxID=1316150 RepID=A0ACA9KHP2_9GLOM|nr:14957_t:CDS:2 [Dentiscutata heterogama]